jgi:AcrR family transcriptional regulator
MGEVKRMETLKPRLNRSDFLNMGLDVLAAEGPRALTAARMAREMNVTTGSFYWHFKTVDEFCEELKSFWRDDIVVGIINDAREQAKSPGDVLEEIGRIIRQRRTDRYDMAMRNWARSDRSADEAVRAADSLRGELIAGVLKDAGASKAQARDKSNLLGAAWVGSQDMQDPDYRFNLMGLITRDSGSDS